jgi:replication factor A3
MAEDVATPRINAQYLDAFRNQTVRIVGRVTQLRGEQATIDAAGNITVILSRVLFSSPPPPFFLHCL